MARKKSMHYSGIGGQAVMEGVMMKNKEKYAVAVRKPDGQIEIMTEEYGGILKEKKIKEVPFIRGIFNFVDSLVLGMKTLMYSASFFEEEETEETKLDQAAKKLFKGKAESIFMGATVALSIIMAIGIFMVLPYFISSAFTEYIRNASLLAIVEGIVRILIFVLYIVAISAMKDIRRVYQYHGAEHKCINCIEKGRPLTVTDVMKCSRQHKRCGTSFLLFVMFVSVVFFFFIRVESPVWRIVLRLLLLPLVAGISYEIIRLAGRSNNIIVRILSAPGLWLQKLTTKEPDREMVEVAIASVEAVFDWKAYFKEEFQYDVDESWLKEDEVVTENKEV